MTDETQKQVAETVARLHYGTHGMFKTPLGGYVRFTDYEALAARLAEVTLHRDELDFLLNEGGEDSVAKLISRAETAEARLAEVTADRDAQKHDANKWFSLALDNRHKLEAAEARVTELEALLAAYQDQTVPDLTAVYIAGGMDRRDEVARLRAALDGAFLAIVQARYRADPGPLFRVLNELLGEVDDIRRAALAAPQLTATKDTKDE